MPVSKYVTQETINDIKAQLERLKEEEKELDLLERTGVVVTDQREAIAAVRKQAQAFLNVYDSR